MAYKPMWDWMDKAEGKKEGSSHANLEKEIKRQGGEEKESPELKKQREEYQKNAAARDKRMDARMKGMYKAVFGKKKEVAKKMKVGPYAGRRFEDWDEKTRRRIFKHNQREGFRRMNANGKFIRQILEHSRQENKEKS